MQQKCTVRSDNDKMVMQQQIKLIIIIINFLSSVRTPTEIYKFVYIYLFNIKFNM